MVKWKERYSLIRGTILSIHYLQHLNSNQNHFNTCSRICNCPLYIHPVTFYVCHLSSHWIWQAHCFSPESSQLENGMKLFKGSTTVQLVSLVAHFLFCAFCCLLNIIMGLLPQKAPDALTRHHLLPPFIAQLWYYFFSSHLIMHIFYFSDPLGRAKYSSKIAH